MQRGSLLGVVMVMVGLVASDADAKGGGIAIPPMRVETGALFPVLGGEAVESAIEVMIGLHWGSLSWRPTSIDIGVGYIGSIRPLIHANRASRTTQREGADDTFSLNGGYLSLAHTIVRQKNFRTWVELRGELLKGTIDARTFSAIGGAVRCSAELFGSGAAAHIGNKSVAIFAGTVSFGVYLEASHRDIALELGPTGITGGFSIRLPFMLAGVAGI